MTSTRRSALAAVALAPWLLAAGEPAPPEPDAPVENRVVAGDAAAGRALHGSLGCGVCHTISGLPGAIGIVGPSLDGFASRPLLAGQLPNRPEILVRYLLDPPALIPATGMPATPMRPEDARDLAAFLATLR